MADLTITRDQAEALLGLMSLYEADCAYGDAQGSHGIIQWVLTAFEMIEDADTYDEKVNKMGFLPPSEDHKLVRQKWASLVPIGSLADEQAQPDADQ